MERNEPRGILRTSEYPSMPEKSVILASEEDRLLLQRDDNEGLATQLHIENWLHAFQVREYVVLQYGQDIQALHDLNRPGLWGVTAAVLSTSH